MNNIKDVKKVCIIGIICNIILLCIKLVAGIISKSSSMIADAIHSIEDALASILAYIGAKITDIPSDNTHPDGHGKVEYVFSLIIAITMVFASVTMFKTIIEGIIYPQNIVFSPVLIIVCILNIVLKFILFCYTKVKYNKTKDILIKASMEDHRNDIFLTSSTLLGVTCGYFKLYIVDSIIAIAIVVWIFYVGIKLFFSSYSVLIDTNLSNEKILEIKNVVKSNSELFEVIDIYGKPIGEKYLVILKIKVKEESTFIKVRCINDKIKENLLKNFVYIKDVIVDIK